MPAMSYDGRSFLIDGRRIWLVSTTFEFSRYRPSQWPGLLKSIKASGFNCVCLPVPWRLVEPVKGKFDFTAERDIKKAVEAAGAAGLYVFLSPGPLDQVTMPRWLLGIEGMKLREANPAFLSAVSKYYTALWEQVAGLQVVTETGPGASSKAGPIALVRLEGNWSWAHAEEGPDYLHELARFHRELGCRVPLVLSNMLHHRVDTVIDAWAAFNDITSVIRQLGSVQPSAPRLLIDLQTELVWAGPWKSMSSKLDSDGKAASSIIQAAASGAQFNLAGSTVHFGPQTRRALHFTSTFGNVFANIDPARSPVVIAPDSVEEHPGRLSLVHQTGTQGELTFIFGKSSTKQDAAGRVRVVQADGTWRYIALGNSAVTWSISNVKLPGLASPLTTDLLVLAWHLGKILVVVHDAPVKASGPFSHDQDVVGINGTTLHIPPAKPGSEPRVIVGEGLTVLALSSDQADTFWPVSDGVIVGPTRLDAAGNLDPASSLGKTWQIAPDGKVTVLKPGRPGKSETSGKVGKRGNSAANVKSPRTTVQTARIGPWRSASALSQVSTDDAFAKASSARSIQAVAGQLPLVWHQIQLATPRKPVNVIAPDWRDKVLLFNGKGKSLGEIDAQNETGPRGKVGLEAKTLLLSRMAIPAGFDLDLVQYELDINLDAGIIGGLYTVGSSIKPTVTKGLGVAIDLRNHFGFLKALSHTDLSRDSSWRVDFKTSSPRVYFRWKFFNPCRAAVVVNGVFAGLVCGDHGRLRGLLLTEANGLKRGANQIAFFDLLNDEDPRRVMSKNNAPELIELGDDLLAKATIRSLPVTPPDDAAFNPVNKNTKPINGPAWCKTQWHMPPADLPIGLTVQSEGEGLVMVNGVYVGQYGRSFSSPIVIDPAVFTDSDEQSMMIFDESGKLPSKLTVSDTWL